MNKLVFRISVVTILILLLGTISNAQTTTRYFKDWNLQKEVPEKKAQFLQSITQNTDGSVTTEIKNYKTGEIISNRTYKGNEPYGIWKHDLVNHTEILDYSFDLKYADSNYCKDSIPGIKDYFKNNNSLNYIAPVVENYSSIIQFLIKNLFYPEVAIDNGIIGDVIIGFTLTDKGEIENIVVIKGANILLDKEAVRVIRKLKFKTAATINGIAQNLCLILPITFKFRPPDPSPTIPGFIT